MLQSGKWWWIAELDGIVVGMISVMIQGSDVAWFSDLFVNPLFRRQGIAVKLIERAEEDVRLDAEESGVAIFSSGVLKTNEASIALCRSRGYRHCYTYDDGTMLFSKEIDA
jgi:GNAT superfamily N-acetyltransferase